MFGSAMYWRETQKPAKFLFVDGRVVVFLLLMVMHIRVWTIVLAMSAIIVVWLFGRKGIGTDSILRFIRATIVGRKRPARGRDEERSAVDYGFETRGMVEKVSIGLDMRHKAHLAKQKKKGMATA